jgi:hypothetical protein
LHAAIPKHGDGDDPAGLAEFIELAAHIVRMPLRRTEGQGFYLAAGRHELQEIVEDQLRSRVVHQHFFKFAADIAATAGPFEGGVVGFIEIEGSELDLALLS